MQEANTIQQPVSVVICTYNAEPYIRPQLDSILAQTHPIKEIVIQDDNSTDHTMHILREYADRYPSIRIFRNQDRQGINGNFFSAIEKTESDFIALSDQDDLWKADKIEKQMQTIGDNWCCFCQSLHFTKTPDYSATDTRMRNFQLERMLFIGSVPGHSMLIRKELYNLLTDRICPTDLRALGNTFWFDTLLASVSTAFGKTVYLPDILVFHRIHPNAATAVAKRKDLSRRTVANAVQLVWRNLSPRKRRVIRPLIVRRMQTMQTLLGYFPDASPACIKNVSQFIHCYTTPSPLRMGRFITLAVKNRNRIFYAPESNQVVAVLRALLFPITMYDFFAVSCKHQLSDSTNQ